MKVLIQRVLSAAVEIDGQVHSQIDRGFLLYVCFEADDLRKNMEKAVKKILALRILEDQSGRMNQDILQKKYSIMSVSQFTLSWNGTGGNRPSFETSMKPGQAREFYNDFNKMLSESVQEVKSGIFGADMKISSVNDGPVTFFLSF